ncbi:hypothetical protein CRE_29095 [Caenorhabditis remanei]|uniref:Uncharacterized protein n=1 Tax=Caenorhabditis remanei TaxID=31234 RepID=E3MWD0_CAERE|nr:hypothetical protein CRE_29095 [Caenorhabditis remanei]
MLRRQSSAYFLISLILFSLAPPAEFRRGGGGSIGGSRGASGGSRGSSSGGFGSRGSSGARTQSSSGAGWLGGGTKTGAGRNDYSRGTNLGSNTRQGTNTGGVWNHQNSGPGWNSNQGQYRGSGGGMNTGSTVQLKKNGNRMKPFSILCLPIIVINKVASMMNRFEM